MAPHHHVAFVPQVAYTAGAILPYPVYAGPPNIAQATLHAFQRALIPALSPSVRQEPQPEAIARMAKRYADAMAAGMKPPSYTDHRLMRAARYINQGVPFVIRSAGRSALVQSSGPLTETTVTAEGTSVSAPNGSASSSEDTSQSPGRTLSWHRY